MEMSEIYGKITKKAWEDEAFKQKLLSDPKAAIREAAGIEIPSSVKVSVHESKSDELYFVLPQDPNKKAAELSDGELDQVAGGTSSGKTPGGIELPGFHLAPHLMVGGPGSCLPEEYQTKL